MNRRWETFGISLAVAAAAGVVGAEAILFFEEGIAGLLAYPPFYAIPSIIPWSILYRLVLNRSLVRAAMVGILSPVVACILFLPFYFVGFVWAIYLIRYWWVTLPVGIGTSLLIQCLASDFGTGYARKPRVLALVALLLAVGVCSAPYAARALREHDRLIALFAEWADDQEGVKT